MVPFKMKASTAKVRAQPHEASGFTLLEVMGAILILVIVLYSLTSSNVSGIRLEANAQRRAEAATLANELIAELEVDISQYTASLEEEITTEEMGDFIVETEVIEYLVELPQLETDEEDEDDFQDGYQDDIERPNLLRMVQVRVLWESHGQPFMIQRTTFAADYGGGMMGGSGPGSSEAGDGMSDPGMNAPIAPEFPQ